jgi:hypothetical protein
MVFVCRNTGCGLLRYSFQFSQSLGDGIHFVHVRGASLRSLWSPIRSRNIEDIVANIELKACSGIYWLRATGLSISDHITLTVH